MQGKQLKIYLLPAEDDAALDSPEYQRELEAFTKTLRSHGLSPQRALESIKAAGGGQEPAVWLGQFIIVVKTLTPVVTGVLGALGGYLHGKRRGVSFEVGKDGRIKGTAQSLKDAEKLLPKLLAARRNTLGKKPPKKKAGKRKRP